VPWPVPLPADADDSSRSVRQSRGNPARAGCRQPSAAQAECKRGAGSQSIWQAYFRAFTAAAHEAACQENGRARHAACASVVPVPRRAPSLVGTRANKTVAAANAANAGSTHSSRAGCTSHRKNFVVMTLAASAAAFLSGDWCCLTRFRYRWLCQLRFCLPRAVVRYFRRAFHCDQARAAWRQLVLQYRCCACHGRKFCSHPFSRHRRGLGRRRAGRNRPAATCFRRWPVGFSGGPMGGDAPRSSSPGERKRLLSGAQQTPARLRINTLSQRAAAGSNLLFRLAVSAILTQHGDPRIHRAPPGPL
jgi:hypothetical protein